MLDSRKEDAIRRTIKELQMEHRELDELVSRLVVDPDTDQLQLVKLKKRKLFLKDQIERLRSKLIPDMDA
jgi:hypothetical protein